MVNLSNNVNILQSTKYITDKYTYNLFFKAIKDEISTITI